VWGDWKGEWDWVKGEGVRGSSFASKTATGATIWRKKNGSETRNYLNGRICGKGAWEGGNPNGGGVENMGVETEMGYSLKGPDAQEQTR